MPLSEDAPVLEVGDIGGSKLLSDEWEDKAAIGYDDARI